MPDLSVLHVSGISVFSPDQRESLNYYDNEISEIAESVVEEVEDNPLSEIGVVDTAQVLEDLEEYRERIQQLHDRRVHEVKRRK